jgi:hypothetical protein
VYVLEKGRSPGLILAHGFINNKKVGVEKSSGGLRMRRAFAVKD